MRSDDLVPLLKPDGGKPVGFRQGVIVSWNPDTAANTVLVGGSLMTNLPILNTSEASLLAEGDVVGILTSGPTWAIMGRFTIPGTPEAVSSIQSITNRIQAAADPSSGSRDSTSWGDLTGTSVGPSVTVRIGSSGRALVLWSCELGMVLDSAGSVIKYEYRNTPHVGFEISGATTRSAADGHALNFNLEHPGPGFTGAALTSFWAQCAMVHLSTGLNAGDNTFTLKYRHDSLNPSASVASFFNAREIAVFAL